VTDTIQSTGWRRIAVVGACLGLMAAGSVPPPAPGAPRVAPNRLAPESVASIPASRGPGPTRRAQLRGTVTLDGDPGPGPTEVINSTDPQVCGRLQSRRDLVVSETNRGIRDVIVAVTGIPEDARPAVEPGRLVLANRDCRFEPHALVATVGATLETVNRDATLHTVHLYGARETNLALPAEGMTRRVVLDTPGMITVLCDVHGWMRAHVRVDPHPFHAVTDAEGRFRIPDLPAGTWELEIWHEKLGTRTRTVHLVSGSTERIEITYSLE